MYIVGEEEVEALASIVRKGALFRYGVGGECERFERRYAERPGRRPLRAHRQRHLRPRRPP